MIGVVIVGMLFVIFYNFIFIGSFIVLLYIGVLFLFRKSEKFIENSEIGIVL